MKRILGLLSILLMVGCTSSPEEQGKKEEKNEKSEEKNDEKETKADSHHHHDEAAKIELNNGEPWEADSSTEAGIENMKALVRDFSQKENLQAHHELADTLQGEFDRIFQECSMEGEGHEQLHNYLLPLKKQLERLRSDQLKEAQKAREIVKKHLGEFEEFFVWRGNQE